jgi:hypothetical protein
MCLHFLNLLTRQGRDTGELLALQQLQAGTATSRDVAQLVLNTVLGRNGRGVTTSDDDSLSVLCGGNSAVQDRLGSIGEGLELEDTWWAVPEDGLGLVDGLVDELDGLGSGVESHPSVRNAGLIGGGASLGIRGELVAGDVVNWQDKLDVVLLGLLDQVADDLAASLIEQAVADLDALEGLLEGKRHATADDDRVDLGEKVVDQLDLVADLGTSEDGEEWALRALNGLGEVLELLLHEEAGGLLWGVNTDHGAVGAVGGSESIV